MAETATSTAIEQYVRETFPVGTAVKLKLEWDLGPTKQRGLIGIVKAYKCGGQYGDLCCLRVWREGFKTLLDHHFSHFDKIQL